MDTRRIVASNGKGYKDGPVVYWMSRDQRINDNWALWYACDQAARMGKRVHVAFCVTEEVPSAAPSHFAFMAEGLQQISSGLERFGIPFHVLSGSPGKEVARFANELGASLLVADYSPLRAGRRWRVQAQADATMRVETIDAHNIVPVGVASGKMEIAARTIRPKLMRLLGEFMEPVPAVAKQVLDESGVHDGKEALTKLLGSTTNCRNGQYPPSGEKAGMARIESFIRNGLHKYALSRDPNEDAQSGLSAYLHFGQVSARNAVHLAMMAGGQGSDEFVEQAFIRRELAENFCAYCDAYDTEEAFPRWAKQSLDAHLRDVRDYLYTLEELEACATHDRLWNAAQKAMMVSGVMPGYLRMYWAKKLLEWSSSPAEAQSKAIYLNDKWSLDGRDPNGYAGIAWSVGGLHDRPWPERHVFGTVRYMSYSGASRKFDVDRYIAEHFPA